MIQGVWYGVARVGVYTSVAFLVLGLGIHFLGLLAPVSVASASASPLSLSVSAASTSSAADAARPAGATDVADPVGAEGVYSAGGWSTLHRGPANRKLVPSAPLGGPYRVWHALAGASVLTAPTMSPDGRTLYVASGRAAGHSNLHAFDLDGELRWRAEPWSDAEHGVDPCAVLSSPIVDREGDIYLGDCNQLFAFRPDGRVKWVVPLPPTQTGDWIASEVIPVNALTTAAFTRAGHVFGVTNSGDIVVFDRETGAALNPPMRLPGRVPPPSPTPMPDSIFSDGLLDPEIREWSWQLLWGGAMRSANTPAVEMESGRIFVAATSTHAGKGALYALDLVETADRVDVEIGFVAEMGPGSGSSPSLSPDAEMVYVSDEEGGFYGVDARSGEIHWEIETKAASAAAAVGANGDIYALQADGPALIAMTRSGQVRWQSDLDAMAKAALPSSWLLGDPIPIGNGNPTVVGNRVLLPVAYGYSIWLGRRVSVPVASSLVEIDIETGIGVRDLVELKDDSTGITAVLGDGTIVSSLGTAITSGMKPAARVARLLMPGDLELLAATGGIQVSRPLGPADAAERMRLEGALAQRSPEDRRSDASRRPIGVLELAGIGEGDRVLDVMSGGGWYAEVLARVVGSKGHVVAHHNAISVERHGDDFEDRAEASGLVRQGRLSAVEAELDALAFAPGSFDAAVFAQFYHDSVWMGVDRAAMNRGIFEALAPGGVLVVIDHEAPAGSGTTQAESLHRIDVDVVLREVTAAGFRLRARSELLANPADDGTTSVFRPPFRGKTNRFLLVFEKPVVASGSPSAAGGSVP